MSNKPDLSNEMSSELFKSYYYLKEELIEFCRKEGLKTAGGKVELTSRIAHYLDTGEKLSGASKSKAAKDIGIIKEESLIEKDFVCSEKHREFFKNAVGKSFSFNVAFQQWLKKNTGKTYRDAIAAYYQILEDKKKGKTTIDKQFEYNTYIRDFFAHNEGKTLEDAIKCWKYKKELQGHNKYEESDLIALM